MAAIMLCIYRFGDAATIAFWQGVLSLLALQSIASFGFTPTLNRLIAAATGNAQQSLPALAQTTRRCFLVIAVIWALFLSAGYFLLKSIQCLNYEFILTYAIVAFSSVLSVLNFSYQVWLEGKQEVA